MKSHLPRTEQGRRFGVRRLAEAARLASRTVMREHGFALQAILTDWAAIVGPKLGSECAPERLSRTGTLTVRVAGPLALELQHRSPEILERIAGYFGHRAVHRLRLVQGPLPKPALRRAPALPPLTQADTATLEAATAGLNDDRLRQALERLGRAVLADSHRLEGRRGPSL